MLEHLPRTSEDLIVIRCSAQFQFSKMMAELEFDSIDSDEFRRLFRRNSSLLDPLEAMCEIPFDSRRKSRYSNGTFGVLYASLDEETAISEITHWFRRWLYGEHRIKNGYYIRFSVHFSGELIDITTMRNDWPSLTSDTHKEFCKSIATEARMIGLDAIIVPSARSKEQNGKNLVVFSKASLEQPTDSRYLRLTYNSKADAVEYTWIS